MSKGRGGAQAGWRRQFVGQVRTGFTSLSCGTEALTFGSFMTLAAAVRESSPSPASSSATRCSAVCKCEQVSTRGRGCFRCRQQASPALRDSAAWRLTAGAAGGRGACQVLRKMTQDARGDRDVAQLHSDTGRVREALQDRQQGVRRQRRRLRDEYASHLRLPRSLGWTGARGLDRHWAGGYRARRGHG